jgi:hypothetical protein
VFRDDDSVATTINTPAAAATAVTAMPNPTKDKRRMVRGCGPEGALCMMINQPVEGAS